MKKSLAILPGDGIGPEVINQSIKILEVINEVFGHDFTFKYGLVGAAAIDAHNDPFPGETEELCKSSDAILFGAIGDPKYDNDPSAKVRPEDGLLRMRKSLGLYANARPVASYEQLLDRSPLKTEIVKGVDFIVFRELTGGIYFGKPRGRSENGEEAFDTCHYSKEEILRVSKLAFEAALNRNKKVTLVDKANVLATSRLWRETVTEFARDYPEVELDFLFVDNAAMQLIQNPTQFDVILTENMFGDIITDEASVITGSLGMLPSASIGSEVALYEPIHGSYPQAAGLGIANPFATMLSFAMMLELSFGLKDESEAISKAIETAIEEDFVTKDIARGEGKSTDEVGDFICKALKEKELA